MGRSVTRCEAPASRRMSPLGLVGSGDGPEADAEAIPGVDSRDGKGQICELLVGELLSRLLEDLIGGVSIRDEGDGLRPGQRGPLSVAVEGRLPPGIQEIQTLLCLAPRPRVLGVHVDAVRAPVDLRGPELHQLAQGWLEPTA